jgi:hypothetical protein
MMHGVIESGLSRVAAAGRAPAGGDPIASSGLIRAPFANRPEPTPPRH